MVKKVKSSAKVKKKLIRANRVFGGTVVNKSNLDFEVTMALKHKQPFKRLSHLTRAMTSGHAFSDGNKRTAVVATMSELKPAGYKVDKRKLVRTMIKLSKTGEGDLKKIERKLRRCTRK